MDDQWTSMHIILLIPVPDRITSLHVIHYYFPTELRRKATDGRQRLMVTARFCAYDACWSVCPFEPPCGRSEAIRCVVRDAHGSSQKVFRKILVGVRLNRDRRGMTPEDLSAPPTLQVDGWLRRYFWSAVVQSGHLVSGITYLIASMLLKRPVYSMHRHSRLRPFQPLSCVGGAIFQLFKSGTIIVAFVTAWWGYQVAYLFCWPILCAFAECQRKLVAAHGQDFKEFYESFVYIKNRVGCAMDLPFANYW